MANLDTHYANPGNSDPGGAAERTQIFLDKNFKINPNAAPKCSPTSSREDHGAGDEGLRQRTGRQWTATATANGLFMIKGCVLLFNGPPQSRQPEPEGVRR